MKKKANTKLRISAVILASSLAVLAAGVSVTYASYKTGELAAQTVGYHGKLDQVSIFLNANIWEVDGAMFYMYNGTSNKWFAPEKTITPTINNKTFILYVFILEHPVHNTTRFVFTRMNPKGQNINSPSWVFNDNPRTIWNQVDDITYDSSSRTYGYNYFCVTEWQKGSGTHNGSEKNDKYESNCLYDNNGSLAFRY